MGEQYTPESQDEVRSWYDIGVLERTTRNPDGEFERWLSAHDREVRARALDEAADDIGGCFGITRKSTVIRLQAWAETLREDVIRAEGHPDGT